MTAPRYASDFPPGHLVKDYLDTESGLRVQVRVGSVSFCAYVGVQADHTLASLEDFDFSCHHYITFRDFGHARGPLPQNWYWWGWDYAHFTDATEHIKAQPSAHLRELLDDLDDETHHLPILKQKRWTADEVFHDALDALLKIKTALAKSQEYYGLLASSYGAAPSLLG